MTFESLDPTAGERARAIRERPGEPQQITDPTDPRCHVPEIDDAPATAPADEQAHATTHTPARSS